MKELNNMVVEIPKNIEEYNEIKNIFKNLGYYNKAVFQDNDYHWYFGIIRKRFDGWRENDIKKANAKIITL